MTVRLEFVRVGSWQVEQFCFFFTLLRAKCQKTSRRVSLFPCCLFFISEGTWMKVVMFSGGDSSIENSLFGQLGALGVVIYASRDRFHMMAVRCVRNRCEGQRQPDFQREPTVHG